MAVRKVHSALQKGIERRSAHRKEGFALVTVLLLIPLLMACVCGVGFTYLILQRKSLAQSLCVHQAAQTQNELKLPLDKLINMNPKASALRARRLQADLRLQQALASGNPGVIAAAKLARQVVIMEQTVFQARQKSLLVDAERIRIRNERELRRRISRLSVASFSSPRFFKNSLALEARPENSLTPDYIPTFEFESDQQQRFKFQFDLYASFPLIEKLIDDQKTTTECSVTLQRRSGEWGTQILAAKAP